MTRRDLLRALTAAGITLPCLPGMAGNTAFAPQADKGPAADRARHLILIELQGGNDGLNTVVPFTDAEYIRLRPGLALSREQILQLDETTGLHNALAPLMHLWNRGDMAIIQGVGYPAPNRSHFRSIEIWDTASQSDETRINGWLQPVTDAMYRRHESPIKALVLGQDEGPLAGTTYESIVFNSLNGSVQQAKNSPKLMHQLDLVARLIGENTGPQIYKVSLGSFDTHANQLQRHAGLLKQLAQGVAHLENRLANSGLWQDVLIMTYSEFGRRAGENGSNGTDHGTAAPHFMMGGSVKGGLYGQPPELGTLANEDVLFTTDFRELYSTVSRNWFRQALDNTPYAAYDTLPILKTV